MSLRFVKDVASAFAHGVREMLVLMRDAWFIKPPLRGKNVSCIRVTRGETSSTFMVAESETIVGGLSNMPRRVLSVRFFVLMFFALLVQAFLMLAGAIDHPLGVLFIVPAAVVGQLALHAAWELGFAAARRAIADELDVAAAHERGAVCIVVGDVAKMAAEHVPVPSGSEQRRAIEVV